MASIIQNDSQLQALNEVSMLLKKVRQLNNLLKEIGNVKLLDEKGDALSLDLSFTPKVKAILEKQRTQWVREITAKCRKHHIALEEEDKKTINPLVQSALLKECDSDITASSVNE